MIVPKLRAAIGVAEEMYPIDILSAIRLFQETVLHLSGHGVDAADGRQDPQFIAHADVTVGATINLYFAIRRLWRLGNRVRLIAIRVKVAEIGARIVRMNMLARRDIRQRMANRQPVLNDVFPFAIARSANLWPRTISRPRVTESLSIVTTLPAAISVSATATLSCEWILMYCISTDLWP